jgi:hypothetical protein
MQAFSILAPTPTSDYLGDFVAKAESAQCIFLTEALRALEARPCHGIE